LTTNASGQLYWATSGSGGGGNTLDQAYDEGGAGAGRLITVDTGAIQAQGTIGTNVFEATGSVDITGSLTVDNGAASGGSINGSIHQTSDGLSYLVAVGGIEITSQSNGQILISGSGGGGGGGGGSLSQIDLRGGSKHMTVSGSPGSDITGTIRSWFDLGMGTYLKVTEYGGTTNTDIELYTSSSRATVDRFYFAQNKNLNAGAHLDLTPWFYEDDETSSQIYYKLTNNGSVTASYDIELVGIGE
jgi:hypothetical protein